MQFGLGSSLHLEWDFLREGGSAQAFQHFENPHRRMRRHENGVYRGAFSLRDHIGQQDYRPVWIVPMVLIGKEPSVHQSGKAHSRHKPINLGALLTERKETCVSSRNGEDLTAGSPENPLQQLTCDGVILDDKNGS